MPGRGHIDVSSALRAVRSVRDDMKEQHRKMARDINAVLDYQALALTAHMKLTAPWTDDTGIARSGLYAVVTDRAIEDSNATNQEVGMALGHSVDYGLWLEIRRDFHGRYAIVIPTLQDRSKDILEMLRQVWS